MGSGIVSKLYEKKFPSEAEFLRAEVRLDGAECLASSKARPELLAHIK
jgi:hypothetical protein